VKYLSVLVLIIGAFLVGCEGSGTMVDPPRDTVNENYSEGGSAFERISQGDNSGVTNAQQLVITSDDAWEALWTKVSASMVHHPPLPQINFHASTIIAVLGGMSRNGGTTIEIKDVIEGNNDVTVVVEYSSPGPGCPVTDAITAPYAIAKIVKTKKPIAFTAQRVARDTCD
jgi:hypothetical protein